MSEVAADVLIVETGVTYKTPFTTDLDAGTYTLKATYLGQTLEKKATITTGTRTIVNFTFQAEPEPPSEPRKGAPSISNAVEVVVNPIPTSPINEPTTLSLTTDKQECFSGDKVIMSGKLVFTTDQVPLAERTISIKENDVVIDNTMTDVNGNYTCTRSISIVSQQTIYSYRAVFGGD